MYHLYYGSEFLFDPYTDNVVYDAKLTAKTNTSDYLDFTVPYGHELYTSLAVQAETVTLYWDEDCLYMGTIQSIETDMEGNLAITCVGALDWLNDSLVRPYSTIEGEQPLTAPSAPDGLFRWYINQHNEHCMDSRKQFAIGENQAALLDKNNYVYRSSESAAVTLDELQNKIVDELGGYLFVDYNPLTINLYSDVHTTNAQIIDFGVNLTDFSSTTDTSEQYTAIRPTGADLHFHLKFADSANPSSDDMTDTPSAYIGTYVDAESSDDDSPSAYWWRSYSFHGSNGIQGNLSDGTALYLHVAYANSSDGKTDFSLWTTDRAYIGQYVDYTQASSENPVKYEWEEHKRSDDDSGSEGPNSCDGPSPITVENLAEGVIGYGGNDFRKKGDVIYSASGVTRYGYREYSYSNTDCTLPSTLQTSACKALNAILSPTLSITVKAVDLSLYMDGYTHLKVGEAVRIRSKFHGVDEYLMVSSIELDLQDPSQSTYELGAEYNSLTGQQSTYLKSLNSNINTAFDSVSALSTETKAAAKDAQAAASTAATASADACIALAAAEAAVASTTTEYATNQDPATAPTEGWSQEQPEWTEGNYIWMRQTVTYGSGEVEFTEPACITGNAGAAGQDAILLHIDSSHGTVFKNADGKTTFTVTIFYGSKTITDKAGLADAFGTSAHLEWKWLKVDEDDWGTIPASDERLSNDGFTLAITSDDVDVKTSFECNLEF